MFKNRISIQTYIISFNIKINRRTCQDRARQRKHYYTRMRNKYLPFVYNIIFLFYNSPTC